MGNTTHHAILVTSADAAALAEVHAFAEQLDACPSPILPPAANGYATFLVPPDGAFEWKQWSNEGDERRCELICCLQERHRRGEALQWVEVQFANEMTGEVLIVETTPGPAAPEPLHHAIVVTSMGEAALEAARAFAAQLGAAPSPVLPPRINGFASFFIPPDGAPEGSAESLAGDARRAQIIAYLESTLSDEDSVIAWVEVQY